MGGPRIRILTLVALSLLLLTPIVPAAPAPSPDAAGASVTLLVDGDVNATRVQAGELVSFTWLLLDDGGRPFVHHDARFRVTLDGEVLLETTPASGHDYDGKDTYRVRVPATAVGGELAASVGITPRGGDAPVVDRVALSVEPPAGSSPEVRVDVVGGNTTADAAVLRGQVEGLDEPGVLAWRVREASTGFDVLRLRTRAAPDRPHLVRFLFPDAARYEVSATLLNGATAADADLVTVDAAPPPAEPAAPPTRPPMENTVETGSAPQGKVLYATYDPYTSVGPHGRIRLGAVLLHEAARRPVEPSTVHVDLEGPRGRSLLETRDAHAPGGLLTVAVHRPEVGEHVLHVEMGNGSASTSLRWSVHPPAVATAAGPQFTTLEAPSDPAEHRTATYRFQVEDAAGVPFMHSEVDLRVVGPDGLPWVTGKLHTHSDGAFPLEMRLPVGGSWRLEASPTALHPSPTPAYYGPTVGSVPAFEVDVAGVPHEDVAGALEAGDALEEVPGFPALLAGLALGLAGVARRRRPPSPPDL